MNLSNRFLYDDHTLSMISIPARDNVPLTTTVCPANCTAGGKHYCFPIPCPLPPCVDPVKSAGDCCEHCPNGKDSLLLLDIDFHKAGKKRMNCRRVVFGSLWNEMFTWLVFPVLQYIAAI